MVNRIFNGNLQKCLDGKSHFTIWRHKQMDEFPYDDAVKGLKEVMCLMAQNLGLVVLLVGPTKIEYSDHKIRNFKFFIFSPTYKVSNEIIFADYSEKLGCVHAYSLGETVSFMDIDLTDEMSIEQILYVQYSAEHEANADEDYEADDEEEAVSEVEAEEEPEADDEVEPKGRPNWYDVESDDEDDVPEVETEDEPQNHPLSQFGTLSLTEVDEIQKQKILQIAYDFRVNGDLTQESFKAIETRLLADS